MEDAKLQEALDRTDDVYQDLIEIANTIFKTYTGEVNDLIKGAINNVDNLTNEDIRLLIIKLSLQSFNFGDVKEKAGLKAELSETLRKEAYAKAFNLSEGSVASKESQATMKTSYENSVELIYNSVASLFKTKLDEIHRVVDALKTVLMSRMSEAKLTATMYEGE